jgi:zinc protease
MLICENQVNSSFQFSKECLVEPDENEIFGLVLANGLQVILMKRHHVPVVTVDIWYKVGSKDEKPGKSGFAHLFEHMMFEGSENVGKAEHMKLINDVGGMVNGSTTQDRTNYWEVVPSNQLELALWLEADRMRSLQVTSENFENQRATVKEERRLRIDNQPYMKVIYELKDEIAYENFAYKHSVIGSMEDLDHASLADVQKFHQIYYRPNNAVLGIVGDFEVKRVVDLVQKYFADIPAGQPIPQVDLSNPFYPASRKEIYHDQFAPFSAYLLTFGISDRTHPDYFILQLLEKILIDGESSRLYRQLVENNQLALHLFGGLDGKFGPGLLFFFGQVYPGKTIADLGKSFSIEIEKLLSNTITDQEMIKGRNKLRAEYIAQQESVRTLADIFCMYTTIFGNPRQFYEEITVFDTITSEEVKQVANKYFCEENKSVIEVIPRE